MLDLLIRRFNHPDFPTPMDMGLLNGKIVYLHPSDGSPPEAAKTIMKDASLVPPARFHSGIAATS
ncbi:hypothetical protein [Paenibacillus humicus]|uniref:hypothetical protein n=1 Tax=Paenibacillus humicus TaxID=412861 RepID=UPI003F14C4A3